MRRRAKAQPTPPPGGSPGSSLRLVAPSERLTALQRERERLLKNIAQKKRSLERLEEKATRVGDQIAQSIRPLLDERQTLSSEIHQVFAEVLGSLDRAFARKRGKIEWVYRTLQDSGIIEPAVDAAEPDFPFDAEERPPFAAGAGGYSAPRDATGPGHESLRGVFRRVAVLLHPDRVQDETEKLARTVAMKEVTSAYEAGDLARLLEIERNHAEATNDASSSNEERRCAALESTIAELRKQLRALSRDAKALKRSGPLAAMADFRRSPSDDDASVIQELVAEAQRDLARLRELREFVRAFRDKKISLETFLAGPPSMRGSVEEDLIELAIEEALGDFDVEIGVPRRKRRHR